MRMKESANRRDSDAKRRRGRRRGGNGGDDRTQVSGLELFARRSKGEKAAGLRVCPGLREHLGGHRDGGWQSARGAETQGGAEVLATTVVPHPCPETDERGGRKKCEGGALERKRHVLEYL